MRFSRARRLRIVSGACLLLFLLGLPLALGLSRPAAGVESEPPGIAVAFATGLSDLSYAGGAALILAAGFALWLIAGQRQQVHRKYLSRTARARRNLVEGARTAAIILGAAGIIVGSLAGLYVAMMDARPDLYYRLPLPLFTLPFALACLIGGGALYAAGRVGR